MVAMKTKRIWIAVLCSVTVCAAVIVAILPAENDAKGTGGQTVTAAGSNSQQATATGSNSPAAVIKGNNSQINQNSPSTVAPQMNVGVNNGNVAWQINPTNSPVTQIITNAGPKPRIAGVQLLSNDFEKGAYKAVFWIHIAYPSEDTRLHWDGPTNILINVTQVDDGNETMFVNGFAVPMATCSMTFTSSRKLEEGEIRFSVVSRP
jgi:hypothetical protein